MQAFDSNTHINTHKQTTQTFPGDMTDVLIQHEEASLKCVLIISNK